ncbi:S1 family peptidase [Streptomyces sp. DSM 41982]|uniref:S1 family peptidase n=1 Tax=Streptomyces evansiae TaxID=3075535 RepID=A0ABD5E462_9ACTN|nr:MULTISPECIES: S1 family peptidase [unclassified Streptomyces]MDT0415397.1 S1 family peptidase [Streptomyces sp. DSM 41982]SCD69639.1 Trypsin [Streptomyces sp. SolWspMP-sol7th]
MHRRPVMRIALSTLALLGGLGVAAGTGTAAQADSKPEQPASAGLLTALQKDFHFTAQQAEQRLAAEKQAAKTDRAAREAAGSAFAGSWFDAKKGTLTVALTGTRTADAVRATGAEVRTGARHSEARLTSVKRAIDRIKAPTSVTGWRVDPRTNRVVVDVLAKDRSDKAVRAFLTKAEDAGPVTVHAVEGAPEKPRPLAAGTVGGDPFYTGNVRCSIGFSVVGGFVTAGHCGQPGQAVYGWDNSYIGNIQGSTFPGDDMAWVNVGSGWWTTPVVLGWGTVSDQLVRGSNVAPVGSSICRSGSTSHWHCGTVLGLNETINYANGPVYEATHTNVCAEPGDSGGSFISGDQAQGVTSGGFGNCTSGGETWFQPVNEILGRYGLTLVTS